MNHLFYIMGKSASGKDSVYQWLLRELPLKPVVLYTTRPRRAHEQDGREYHFITVEQLREMRAKSQLLESRTYHTEAGDWTYCTAKDAADLSAGSYLAIGTLESYLPIRAYYGEEAVVPIYIEVDDGVRLARALERERQEKSPRYTELCRRFLADAEDYAEENLMQAEIGRRFENQDFAACTAEIRAYIAALLADDGTAVDSEAV